MSKSQLLHAEKYYLYLAKIMTINSSKALASAVLASAVILSSCATKPENIKASYVSPVTYSKYSCKQLGVEAQRVSAKAAEVSGVQKKKATNDAVATGVALVVFWPAVFFIKGDGTNGAELANLKGQMEAIESASTAKKCGLKFRKV